MDELRVVVRRGCELINCRAVVIELCVYFYIIHLPCSVLSYPVP